ncbi:ABC transporter permease [Ancylobacter sp. TS-1]|uniref:ABC transporter permease n=1 Tax=Ancylobacter sp. TS-1 TaxID=1850374 RepID=UPI001265CEA1|nr:ABC transporter permease [Ancylobacter sp. TS-1]QFR34649.1 ABC transporter permease subunit [Ancylobacter sp. TS-1]
MNAVSPSRAGWALVLPLVAFIVIAFLAPIATMLVRSVHDPEIADLMPRTRQALAQWDGAGVRQVAFDAVSADLREASATNQIGRLAQRLNRERNGLRVLIDVTVRHLEREPDAELSRIDPGWSDPALWQILARVTSPWTGQHLLNALDLTVTPDGAMVRQEEARRLYVDLFLRTAWVAALVTLICALLGYPYAYAMAAAGPSLRALLLFLVLLPFWTSLLVRATAWIVLLQRRGVINEGLLATGLIGETGRLDLIYNMTGTIIVMVHVLLPFFVLPLYSVMAGLPTSYVRASASLGAHPMRTFARVYLPLTYPGVAAGGLLVFILSLGYYVTPALVGGRTGQLISNQIAFHMQRSLNWGLAAALGTLLLLAVLLLALTLPRLAERGGLRA